VGAPGGALSGRLDTPRKVAHMVQFGFDVDVLEIHLHELYDVVDRFVVVEAISAHGKAKRGKPLLWDRVKHQPRFARFADKVLHFVVDDADLEALVAGSHGDSVFAMEYLQEQRRWEKFVQWNALAKEFGDDDMVRRFFFVLFFYCFVHRNNQILTTTKF